MATAEGTSGTRGGGGGVSEEFANRRRYDNEGDIERAAVIRSTMNAAKTKTSHIITGKKPPEKEQRLANGPDDDDDGQRKLVGFVDKLKEYADRNSGGGIGGGSGGSVSGGMFNSALEDIKQRISGPLSMDTVVELYEDDYGSFFDDEEEPEWAAFEEPEDRVEVVNLVFAPEAVEESDGTPIKIFPASELEKLKVTLADRALFFTNYQFSFISL